MPSGQHSTGRASFRPQAGVIAFVAFAAVLASCARDRRASEPAPPEPSQTLPEAIRGSRVDPAAVAPGLEVRTVVVDDRAHAVGALLRGVDASGVTLVGASAGTLQAAGLRVVALPEAELESLLGPLRPLSAIDRRRLGELHGWHAVATGPPRPAATLEGPVVLVPAGRARLLARAWFAPDDPGRLRIELLPQALRDGPATADELAARLQGRRPEEVERGTAFNELATALLLPVGWAVVLVPEDPAMDWSQLPEPELALASMELPAGEPASQDAAPGVPDPDAGATEPEGDEPALPEKPRVREPRTLGERMLAAPAEYQRGRTGWVMTRPPRKALLVLIAHGPPGRAASAASTPEDPEPPAGRTPVLPADPSDPG